MDAVFKAIARLTEIDAQLKEYEIRSVGSGADTEGEVTVRSSTAVDVIVVERFTKTSCKPAVRAFVKVINRIGLETSRSHGVRRCRQPLARRSEDPEPREAQGPAPNALREDLGPDIVRPEQEAPRLLYIDLHLIHEVTSPQAFDLLRERGLRVRRPERTMATDGPLDPDA